jgi:hypothetical protein
MDEMYLYRNEENRAEKEPDRPVVTGEVIFESVHRTVNKKMLKRFVQKAVEKRVEEIRDEIIWASYLVIFSPGQEYEEIRCQVDIETDGERAGFSIGYGQRPNHAFNDALERLQWFEKNMPNRMIV